jgi:hypothetical protein
MMAWEYSRLPKFLKSRRDLIPNQLEPFTASQEWENINHSAHHDFETEFIDGEWNSIDIQTGERALRE